MLRIAILGGGGLGACAALELASHGHSVDIYEQGAEPVMRASRVNEGKIHQGFIYAKDTSLRTARTVATGAVSFTAILSRWIDVAPERLPLSTPFVYAAHKDSMIDLDAIEHHYDACCSVVREVQAESGLRYLGLDEMPHYRRLSAQELESILDPAHFLAAYVTSERSLDPREMAQRLRRAVLSEPRITFIGHARVTAVSRSQSSGFKVSYDNSGPQLAGPYDQVVNALWEGRLAIDRTMGIDPPRSWMHRHKFANRVLIPLAPADLPSVTMVVGPFGDIVNFGQNGMFLSWYPIGMVLSSTELEPPRGWDQLGDDFRHSIFQQSLEVWSKFCPKLARLKITRDMVDPTSGMIFAWGETDIDDPNSKLHDRYDIGVYSVDGYHSVNTGKYTMAPYLALKTAERILDR